MSKGWAFISMEIAKKKKVKNIVIYFAFWFCGMLFSLFTRGLWIWNCVLERFSNTVAF